MNIKLICIDMDGTLLIDHHNVGAENKAAIKKALDKGIHVAITTGRVYNSAKLYSKEIGLKTPIIASNGAYIGGTNGETIFKNPLSLEDIKDFLTITEKYKLLSYLTANFGLISTVDLPEDNVYKVFNKTQKEEDKILFKVVNSYKEAYKLYGDDILKGVCLGNDTTNDLDKAKSELLSLDTNLEIVSSWNNNFEVMKKGSSKGNAVKHLAEYLNLTSDEVMCIGDSENDISMLEFAGTSVAMGNALDKVKEISTYVTLKNSESGVAKAIEKFVLN